MDDFKNLCPVCKSKGLTNFLQLRQIDMCTAVYLCKDVRCIYPQGHSWIYVDRKLSDNEDSDSDSDINEDLERFGILLSQKQVQEKQKTTEIVNDNLAPNLNADKDKVDMKEIYNETIKEMNEKLWNQNIKNMISIEIVQPTITDKNTEEITEINKKNTQIKSLFNSNNVSDIKAMFTTKLKLKTKSTKEAEPSPISDEILKQALQTIQTEKEEEKPKKKRNIVEIITGKKNNFPDLKNSASSFEGFKFSSKIIKPPVSVSNMKVVKTKAKRIKATVVNKCNAAENSSKDVVDIKENKSKDDATFALLNDLIDTVDDNVDKNTPFQVDDPEFDAWLQSFT